MKTWTTRHHEGVITWFSWGLGFVIAWDRGPELELTIGPVWMIFGWRPR